MGIAKDKGKAVGMEKENQVKQEEKEREEEREEERKRQAEKEREEERERQAEKEREEEKEKAKQAKQERSDRNADPEIEENQDQMVFKHRLNEKESDRIVAQIIENVRKRKEEENKRQQKDSLSEVVATDEEFEYVESVNSEGGANQDQDRRKQPVQGTAFREITRLVSFYDGLDGDELSWKDWKQGIYNALIYMAVFSYLEVVLHLLNYGKITVYIVIPILFACATGCLTTCVGRLFNTRVNRLLSQTIVIVVTIYFEVQLIYFHIFERYLCFYSIGAVGGDALAYWREGLAALGQCVFGIVLLTIPCILVFVRKCNISYSPHPCQMIGVMAAAVVIFHIGALIALRVTGMQRYSPYDLYHYNWVQELGIQQVGLLTGTRKDLGQMLFGSDELVLESMNNDALIQEEENKDPAYESSGVSDQTETNQDEVNSDETDQTETNQDEVNSDEIDQTGTIEEQSEVQSEEQNETGTGESEVIDTSPNVLAIDFDALEEETTDKTIQTMHEYFKSQTPTNKNAYTGMFEGYNLIMITAEAFSPYAIDEELTPTLYQMSQEGFVFNNFYTPLWWCSTSDGEYVACTSQIPKNGVTSMYVSGSNYMPFCLGNQFEKLGYSCLAYHDHTYTYYHRDISHPNMGYEYKGVGNGLELTQSWPESDLEMMEKTVPEYINEEPFHVYYMTVSGHMNYTFLGNAMAYKHKSEVEDLPYSEGAKAYLACNIELDQALEELVDQLTAAGIADHTVIALSADHYPYGLEKSQIDELAGHEVEENFEIYKNAFLLWTPSIKEQIVVDRPCSSLDILPTLSNLFGLEYDSRLLMGQDIFSDSDPLVILSNRSFVTDQIMYNSTNGKVTNLTGEKLPDNYVESMNEIVSDKFKISQKILETDYYNYLKKYLVE